MTLDLTQHPCFNPGVRGDCARIHLPVAPKCNMQCNYCNRKYDCMNESRPGVTSAVLEPQQVIEYLDAVVEREPRLSVVGIAGPGDPFAEPERTIQTLELVREHYPQMLLCVASNGLNVAPFVEDLARVQTTHVTITVNAVDPAVGASVYAWLRLGRQTYRGVAAAKFLLERQLEAIALLKQHGITVKINSIIIPGVNDQHIQEVARTMAELKADVMNCMPLFPTTDTVFENIEQPPAAMVDQVRRGTGSFLPQMTHCMRCRSDAVGLLGHDRSSEFASCMQAAASSVAGGHDSRPCVAVASWEGMLVNQHLGEAAHLWIFRQTAEGFEHIATRSTPPSGAGGQRWLDLAETLKDCRAVLVNSVGATPRSILASTGVRVIEMEGVIEEGLDVVYRGGDARALRKPQARGCGQGCTGSGHGCG